MDCASVLNFSHSHSFIRSMFSFCSHWVLVFVESVFLCAAPSLSKDWRDNYFCQEQNQKQLFLSRTGSGSGSVVSVRNRITEYWECSISCSMHTCGTYVTNSVLRTFAVLRTCAVFRTWCRIELHAYVFTYVTNLVLRMCAVLRS